MAPALSVLKVSNEHFTMKPEVLTTLNGLSGPFFITAIAGYGRSGKSELLSLIIRRLGNLAGTAKVFTTSSSTEACTTGVDLIAVPRAAGGTWIFLDCEGTDNGPTIHHPKLTALASQLCGPNGTLSCVEKDIFDGRAINSIADMIAQSVSVFGSDVEFPSSFNVLVNKSTLDSPPDCVAYYNERIAASAKDPNNNTDRALIRKTFPAARLQMFEFERNESVRNDPTSYFGVRIGELVKYIEDNTKASTVAANLGDHFQALMKKVNASDPIVPSTRAQAITEKCCKALAKEHFTKFEAAVKKDCPKFDGRTTEDKITAGMQKCGKKNEDEFVSEVVKNGWTSGKKPALEWLQKKIKDAIKQAIKDNAHQAEIVRTDTETKHEDINRREVHVGNWSRTVWFHTDRKEFYHTYVTRVTYARTKTTQRNGDINYTAWVEASRGDVKVGNWEKNV